MKEKKEKPNSFVKDGLSRDEAKFSVLMLTYFISFIVCTAFFTFTRDGEGLKSVFFSIIGAVTGLKITNVLTKTTPPKEDKKDNDDNSQG